jgi:hypothetical protein
MSAKARHPEDTMHPEFMRRIAADHIADLTRQAARFRRTHPARRLLRNPLRRVAR